VAIDGREPFEQTCRRCSGLLESLLTIMITLGRLSGPVLDGDHGLLTGPISGNGGAAVE
jgi:hypothetical protein